MKNKYELILFFRKNIWKCMVAVVLQLFMASSVIKAVMQSQENFDFFQLWILSFDGNREFIKSQMEPFELPILWIVFQVYILFLVGDNITDHLQGYGVQQLLRFQKRKSWMICRTIISTIVILLYYVIYALALIVGGRMNGDTMFVSGVLYNIDAKYLVTIIALPILVSLTLCYIQNTISLLFNSYIAYIVSIGILIMSAYWKNNFLIGNYAMLLRNQIFREDGVSTINGVIVCLFYSVLAIGIGIICINRYDVLGKGRK